jgi:hypothetical protein
MSVAGNTRQSPVLFASASCETASLDAALDQLTGRLDEIEHELVQLLATCSDDLCTIGNEQGQLLETQHTHLADVLVSLSNQIGKLEERLVGTTGDREEIEKRFLERRNLKQLWLLCEERRIQKQTEAARANANANTNTNAVASHDETVLNETDRLSALSEISLS